MTHSTAAAINPETGTPFSREELQTTFDLVCDQDDWRAPIETIVPSQVDFARVIHAIEFFTATTPTFTPCSGGVRVTAKGYRAGPAGP